MDSFTERIAGFIEQITHEQLSSAAIEAGKRSIIDCLGVALAGCDEDASRITGEYAGDVGRPEAGVIGGGFKTSVDQAA